MELTGWKGAIYRLGDQTMKLAWLNILWLAGILAGGIIAGVFPSTAAMFSVMRKWQHGGELEKGTYALFKEQYRKEFLKANLYGLLWGVIGVILYVDLQFFRSIPSLWGTLFSFFFFILGAVYLAAFLFAFPMYVQYELRLLQYVKNAVLIALSHPLYSVVMALGFYFPYYLMIKVPGLLPFFGGTLIAMPLMILSSRLFEQIERKEEDIKA
ncbi:hypothetical protein B14911_03989 [Bacillus sp. NRRL B-14911]|uniref:DUF624 domain-containing protein n=2 Tax=Bacillaceae TaxID=186817 RepID=U5LET0_9BACI|nr:hypothetical protein N288_22600 [Bacillus infantis NRRL B-14911]EAR68714.1 hypothetical protein B14911_03989 [Bacillus sp. NRRL B-14911]